MATLPREALIFSAELCAITVAASAIVMSDSWSVLKALSDIRNKQPVIRKLLHDIGAMGEMNKEIEMRWIPSHIGIRGNEEADQKAVADQSSIFGCTIETGFRKLTE